MAIVKADAYGMGICEVAKHVAPYVDYFGVAIGKEGVKLRSVNEFTPILLLIFDENDIDLAYKYHLTMSISSIAELCKVVNYMIDKKCTISIHFAINTGMNRYGFNSIHDVKVAIDILRHFEKIKLTGIYSHLYDSDDIHNKLQINLFKKYVDFVKESAGNDIISHLYASHGILRGDNSFDMVRLGIDMYTKSKANTKDCFCLKSTVQSIRQVNKGEFVGYSCYYRAKCDIIVAVIYGGYADGIDKRLSNFEIDIEGGKAPIIGDICMDVFFADITNLSGVRVGSEVTIIGDDITIEDVSNYTKVSNYEIITNTKGRCIRSYKCEE